MSTPLPHVLTLLALMCEACLSPWSTSEGSERGSGRVEIRSPRMARARPDAGLGASGPTVTSAADGGAIDAGAMPATDPEEPSAAEPDANAPGPAAEGGAAMTVFSDELVNARDLGGAPLSSGKQVAYGALFRGPPLALSSRGCHEFTARGIRTVLDLRIEAEFESAPEAPCVEQSARIVHAALPVPYSVSPADYIADLDTSDSVATAFRVLGERAAYPIYFHCTWGRDRTGILAAVILLALGAARETILDEYLLSSKTVGAYPDSLSAAIDEIGRRGGVEAYLSAVGVTGEQLATMRARMIETAH
jgi:protein-tyrosine phosphatase